MGYFFEAEIAEGRLPPSPSGQEASAPVWSLCVAFYLEWLSRIETARFLESQQDGELRHPSLGSSVPECGYAFAVTCKAVSHELWADTGLSIVPSRVDRPTG